MTERETLEILLLKVRVEAMYVLLRGLYNGLANNSPTAAQAIRDQFAAWRQNQAQIALPGVPPEYADMVAGEYQDELDDLLVSIESGFRTRSSGLQQIACHMRSAIAAAKHAISFSKQSFSYGFASMAGGISRPLAVAPPNSDALSVSEDLPKQS